MIYYLVDRVGRYVGTLDESELPTTEEGYSTTLLPPPRTTDYWDGTQWVAIGMRPAYYFEFDYEIKDWVDSRNLETTKQKKWNDIKLERNKLEFGGFMFKGKKFDSDYISQGRILAAIFFGQPTEWTLADDSTIELSVEDLRDLGVALATHVNTVHYRGRVARQAVAISQTPEEVDAVIF